MRVLNVAEQKFGTSVDENCAHGYEKQTFNAKRRTSNTETVSSSCRAKSTHPAAKPNENATGFLHFARDDNSVRRSSPNQAAVLSCFLRIKGSFLPSTTARLIVTSAISSRLGTSYI